jgi:hypothetical protein
MLVVVYVLALQAPRMERTLSAVTGRCTGPPAEMAVVVGA